MNRKNFLASLLPAGLVLTSATEHLLPSEKKIHKGIKIPPYLKAGDLIGITSPAGYISKEDIQPTVQQLESWGLRVKTGKTIGSRDFSFGGTDEERRKDFQEMLDDSEVRAIMCARGGYGSLRIIDSLNFSGLARSPKWIIGFSDVTVIHCHLNRQCGVASIHSKMCNSFPTDWSKAEPVQVETILSIKKALFGEPLTYDAPSCSSNRAGTAEGILVGGNLRTIENLGGSRSDIITKDKILFVEDTGEYLYSIDRMFLNLKRSGKLSALAGLIVGGFKVKPDDPGEEFGRSLYEIVLEKVSDYNYPVAFDFPVGHQKNNYALKCGIQHRLEVSKEGGRLTEHLRRKG